MYVETLKTIAESLEVKWSDIPIYKKVYCHECDLTFFNFVEDPASRIVAVDRRQKWAVGSHDDTYCVFDLAGVGGNRYQIPQEQFNEIWTGKYRSVSWFPLIR